MRLDIRYSCRFAYHEPVRESLNELRVAPTTDERQQLVSYRVSTTPPARIHSTIDYWGTRVDSFGIRTPHDELHVVAEAAVETSPARLLTAAPRLSHLADPDFVDAHLEFLDPSPYVGWGDAVVDEARQRVGPVGDDVVSAVLAVHRAVGTSLRYLPGSTEVGTSVDAVLADGEGVCQDFAHLSIAMCRAIGVPARYVSGYLFTADDATGADVAVDLVNVQTHAWFEAAIPGVGWWPLDPTNRQDVAERHVAIGRGRDYGDVPPLKGAFSGPREHELTVDVEMRRGQATPVQRRPRKPMRDQPRPPVGAPHVAQRQQQQ